MSEFLRRPPSDLRAIEEALAGIFSSLASRCSQIVLFGSRAAGCERDGSDWDLLCVLGSGEAPLKVGVRSGVDLVWKTEAQVKAETWLVSELAGHIARYGRPLQGHTDWFSAVYSSSRAADEKVRRLRRLSAALDSHWQYLRQDYRNKYALKVRRDLQRLWLLEQQVPVPPSRLLDDMWDSRTREQWRGIQGAATHVGAGVVHEILKTLGERM